MLITRDGLPEALAGWHADLTRYRARLDRINTLPVPDHDTGTNLLATAAELLAAAAAAGGPAGGLAGGPAGGRASLGGYDTFGNSGMLVGAWLDGAAAVLDVPASPGELARAAAAEVELAIAAPRPGLFLDYAVRAAGRLAEADAGPDGDAAPAVTDDLRMLLIETAAAAPGLRQRADSGSVGLYFLLRRLLGAGPQAADEVLFEPWPGEAPAGGRVDHELAEFLFTVQGAGRGEVLSLLHRLGMDSVMLGRGPHGGIRVHCHGPGRLATALAGSLAGCGLVRDFRAGPVYAEGQR
jgi:hypothetical protein